MKDGHRQAGGLGGAGPNMSAFTSNGDQCSLRREERGATRFHFALAAAVPAFSRVERRIALVRLRWLCSYRWRCCCRRAAAISASLSEFSFLSLSTRRSFPLRSAICSAWTWVVICDLGVGGVAGGEKQVGGARREGREEQPILSKNATWHGCR